MIVWADPQSPGPTAGDTRAAGTAQSERQDGADGSAHGDKPGKSDEQAAQRANGGALHEEKGDQQNAANNHADGGTDHQRKTAAAMHGSIQKPVAARPGRHPSDGKAGDTKAGVSGVGIKAAARAPEHAPLSPAAPGLAVAGNAVAPRTAVKATMGGPITFDPKKHELVIIGGTAMARSRRF